MPLSRKNSHETRGRASQSTHEGARLTLDRVGLVGLAYLAVNHLDADRERVVGLFTGDAAGTAGKHNLEERRDLMEARPDFRCDGRRRCTEMTSCAEAKFFIENCPNTRMDGDGDGVPCEKQWCNGRFAR
jgi:Excalibur calcium-binding domain